jgi:hypothetical protein
MLLLSEKEYKMRGVPLLHPRNPARRVGPFITSPAMHNSTHFGLSISVPHAVSVINSGALLAPVTREAQMP